MLYVFVGALVFGGILLGASLLVGDGHGDVDPGIDGNYGMPVSADAVDAAIGVFRSLRFWTFFLAFFGLTGTLLTALGVVQNTLVATLLAVLAGSGAGYSAVWTFRIIDRKGSNSMAMEGDFIGKSGRVLVAIAPDGVGKVRVQARGSTVDLLAKSDEAFAIDEEALIIEMDGHVARVSRADTSFARGE